MTRWVLALVILLVPGCLAPGAPHGNDASPGLANVVVREAIRFQTEAGPITVLLYPEAAPETVQLMKQYVAERYYVGRFFGRTVPGHVIQIADASGGATDDPRRVPLETDSRYPFAAGAVGIARDQDPRSGGPEFFIMDYATSHLNGNYTVWGQVVSGMGVVHDIAQRPALDAPAIPPFPEGAPVSPGLPFDRLAIVPVRIRSAQLETISLLAETDAHYPLQVAQNVRVADLRHSLDYPADLRANATSDLTWYVRPYSGKAPTGHVEVREGEDWLSTASPQPGIYAFSWQPGRPGSHNLTLTEGGTALATLSIWVPA